MSSPNFQTILNQSPTEVIRPKPLPKGTYLQEENPVREVPTQAACPA
jgi:hypothetical protein